MLFMQDTVVSRGQIGSALMAPLMLEVFLDRAHHLHCRQLAWPFRAWAALLDDQHRTAQSRPKAAASSPATALMQRYREQKGRRLLHDSFWHWQVAATSSSCPYCLRQSCLRATGPSVSVVNPNGQE